MAEGVKISALEEKGLEFLQDAGVIPVSLPGAGTYKLQLHALAPQGGVGSTVPTTETVAQTATVGVLTESSRADHKHALPGLVTVSVDGFMSSADKTVLNGAASAATASTLMKRDSAGRAQVVAPVADTDIATKAYVDLVAQGVNPADLGREVRFLCYNGTGATIAAGKAVYVSGSTAGGVPTVALAIANAKQTCAMIGVASAAITNGSAGDVCFLGEVVGINTAANAAGAILYVSDTVAGSFVSTPPAYPSYEARLGRVLLSNASGTLLVIPDTDPNVGSIPGGVVFRELTLGACFAVGGKGSFSNANGMQFGTSFYASAQWKPTRVRFRNSQGNYTNSVRIGIYDTAGTTLLAESAYLSASGDQVVSGALSSVLASNLVPGTLYHAVICSKSNGMSVYGITAGSINSDPRMGFLGQIAMNNDGNGDWHCPASVISILGAALGDRAWVEFF